MHHIDFAQFIKIEKAKKFFLCKKSGKLKHKNCQPTRYYVIIISETNKDLRMLAESLCKYNPIDDIECLFTKRQHSTERRSNSEIVVEISGKWDNMLNLDGISVKKLLH